MNLPITTFRTVPLKLKKHTRYLHIALNNTMDEALRIAKLIPPGSPILLEAGTPLIKHYGMQSVRTLKNMRPDLYIIADIKCTDFSEKEIQISRQAGADALTIVGVAPIPTLNTFIEICSRSGMDTIIDMMNITDPLPILRKLNTQPAVVMLHRGVDETENNKEKQIPFYQIKQIKGNYNSILVDIGGGDQPREIQSAIFNDADIVMVWKAFYQTGHDIPHLIKEFLKLIQK